MNDNEAESLVVVTPPIVTKSETPVSLLGSIFVVLGIVILQVGITALVVLFGWVSDDLGNIAAIIYCLIIAISMLGGFILWIINYKKKNSSIFLIANIITLAVAALIFIHF